MTRSADTPVGNGVPGEGSDKLANVRLRLYVARSTPNSVRATSNLTAALAESSKYDIALVEVIDVFAQPKRAMTDGVIVTPTLIATGVGMRVVLMGDLADRAQLDDMLSSLLR